ncbi:MAG: hypothetical protein ACOYJJ_00905 [Anaerovoracaceae bacterium]|jgi:hypothetical protein
MDEKGFFGSGFDFDHDGHLDPLERASDLGQFMDSYGNDLLRDDDIDEDDLVLSDEDDWDGAPSEAEADIFSMEPKPGHENSSGSAKKSEDKATGASKETPGRKAEAEKKPADKAGGASKEPADQPDAPNAQEPAWNKIQKFFKKKSVIALLLITALALIGLGAHEIYLRNALHRIAYADNMKTCEYQGLHYALSRSWNYDKPDPNDPYYDPEEEKNVRSYTALFPKNSTAYFSVELRDTSDEPDYVVNGFKFQITNGDRTWEADKVPGAEDVYYSRTDTDDDMPYLITMSKTMVLDGMEVSATVTTDKKFFQEASAKKILDDVDFKEFARKYNKR